MGSPESADPSRYFAQVAAFVAVAVGLFVLAGWAFDMEPLTYVVPGWPKMARLTALAFAAAGFALGSYTLRWRLPAVVGAALVVAAGLLVLARNAAGWNAYVEQLTLAQIPADTDGIKLPRMAPVTAINFILLGLSMLIAQHRRGAEAHQALAILAAVGGWLGLSRFVFGGLPIFTFANMAVHTALLFLLLAAAALTLRTDAGIARLLASRGVGGSMARRLLPAAIVVPLLAGAITLQFERYGTFGFEGAVSIFALSSSLVFVTFRVDQRRAWRARRQSALDAERALKLSEERNQLIVETALDAVIAINSKGLVTGWNTQAEKMFGWPRGEVTNHELAEIIIPERLRDEHRTGLRRYMESGVARVLNRRVEMPARHRDGHEFAVELAITPIGFGEDVVFSAFIRDITSRLRAESALRESEQRFRTTANAAPVLIWMSGPDKRCTWFNQRWLDFVGRGIEKELGDGWCDNLHPADFDRTLDTYHEAFDARRPL
jgi:PAS domain S-box-containing protein